MREAVPTSRTRPTPDRCDTRAARRPMAGRIRPRTAERSCSLLLDSEGGPWTFTARFIAANGYGWTVHPHPFLPPDHQGA